MSLRYQNILNIRITIAPREIILEEIKKYLFSASKKRQKTLSIATPNPEQIVLAQSDVQFAGMLNRADVTLPDGIGVALAAGCARIPGVEFMEDLVGIAAERGVRIGLIGGRAGLAVRALECLSRRWPGLSGWTVEPETVSMEKIIEKIKKTKTRMVFVGLGAPKQEFFIEALSRQLSAVSCILMSVGGSFDIIAGRLKRAPLFIRSIGFEWLWRLFQEPWRWRRQLALLKFMWLVVREKLSQFPSYFSFSRFV